MPIGFPDPTLDEIALAGLLDFFLRYGDQYLVVAQIILLRQVLGCQRMAKKRFALLKQKGNQFFLVKPFVLSKGVGRYDYMCLFLVHQ